MGGLKAVHQVSLQATEQVDTLRGMCALRETHDGVEPSRQAGRCAAVDAAQPGSSSTAPPD